MEAIPDIAQDIVARTWGAVQEAQHFCFRHPTDQDHFQKKRPNSRRQVWMTLKNHLLRLTVKRLPHLLRARHLVQNRFLSKGLWKHHLRLYLQQEKKVIMTIGWSFSREKWSFNKNFVKLMNLLYIMLQLISRVFSSRS